MNDRNPRLIGFVQALGLTAYVLLVASFMQAMGTWFKDQQPTPVLVGALMLLLFVFSALVSATIVLGYPILRFLDGKRDVALRIFAWCAFWIIIFIIGFLCFLVAAP